MNKSAVVIINGAGGSEPQDIQALVQALLHAHRVQVDRGIMAFPPLGEQSHESQRILDAYAAAYPDLQTQLSDLPLPADLYSVLARDGVGRLEVGGWPDTADDPLGLPDQLPLEGEEQLVVLNWQAAPELTRAIQQHPAAKGRIRALDLKPRQPNELLPDDGGRPSHAEALLDLRGDADIETARASPTMTRNPEGGLHPNDPMAVRTAAADLETLDPVADQEQFGAESAASVPNASSGAASQGGGAGDVNVRSSGVLSQPSVDARLEPQASEPRSASGDPATSDRPISPQPEPVRQDDATVSPKPESEPQPSNEAPAAPAESASDGSESRSRLPPGPQVSEPAKSALTEEDDEAVPDLDEGGAALATSEEAVTANEPGSGIADVSYPATTAIGDDSEAYPLPGPDGTFGAIFELCDLLDANVDSSGFGEAESMLAKAFPVQELEPEPPDGVLSEGLIRSLPCDNDARAGADPPSPADGDPPECPPVAWPVLDS